VCSPRGHIVLTGLTVRLLVVPFSEGVGCALLRVLTAGGLPSYSQPGEPNCEGARSLARGASIVNRMPFSQALFVIFSCFLNDVAMSAEDGSATPFRGASHVHRPRLASGARRPHMSEDRSQLEGRDCREKL
jgi:hypothetical protein